MTTVTFGPSEHPSHSSRPFRAVLLGAQILLALLFFAAGVMKMFVPMEILVDRLVWPAAIPEAAVRFIGVAETLGAIGLLLPIGTPRAPAILTPLAATGLATIMGLAVMFHIFRAEFQMLPVNIVLGTLAIFVGWGRYAKAPFERT